MQWVEKIYKYAEGRAQERESKVKLEMAFQGGNISI